MSSIFLVDPEGIEPSANHPPIKGNGFTVRWEEQDPKNLEHTTGFEPVVLQFCRLLHWTTLPRVHVILV